MRAIVVFAILLSVSCFFITQTFADEMETNREFNVKLKAGVNADEVADSLGFINKGKVFDRWYTFEHKLEHYVGARDVESVSARAESSLKEHPHIEVAEINARHEMQKRRL